MNKLGKILDELHVKHATTCSCIEEVLPIDYLRHTEFTYTIVNSQLKETPTYKSELFTYKWLFQPHSYNKDTLLYFSEFIELNPKLKEFFNILEKQAEQSLSLDNYYIKSELCAYILKFCIHSLKNDNKYYIEGLHDIKFKMTLDDKNSLELLNPLGYSKKVINLVKHLGQKIINESSVVLSKTNLNRANRYIKKENKYIVTLEELDRSNTYLTFTESDIEDINFLKKLYSNKYNTINDVIYTENGISCYEAYKRSIEKSYPISNWNYLDTKHISIKNIKKGYLSINPILRINSIKSLRDNVKVDILVYKFITNTTSTSPLEKKLENLVKVLKITKTYKHFISSKKYTNLVKKYFKNKI